MVTSIPCTNAVAFSIFAPFIDILLVGMLVYNMFLYQYRQLLLKRQVGWSRRSAHLRKVCYEVVS